LRVTDLARKLGIPTQDLRPRLPKFDVEFDAQQVETEHANEIFRQLAGQVESKKIPPKEPEPEHEFMSMVFEDDSSDEEVELENENEKKDDKNETESEVIDDQSEEEETGEEEETEEENQAKDEAEKEFKPKLPSDIVKQPPKKTSQEQKEARHRWARAKKASEKILKRTIKKMEKEKVKRLAKQQEKMEQTMAGAADTTAAHDKIKIAEVISVRELGEKMSVSPIKVLGELLKNGVMANLNQVIDFDTATLIAENFGCKVTRDTAAVSGKDLLKGNIQKLLEDDPKNLNPRPPIVAVLGHVDHGKTTLLDAIRQTNIVAGESGGITQHIGACQVNHDDKIITFLDTPGHEAFTAMRARGARATDIAILVVAAEEGIKPQTIEAINHARDAEVPIIVAITKIDKPGANIEKVKGELAEQDLQSTDWGGKIEVVGVSAPQKKGLDELLDLILLVNEMNPVQANPQREAVCTIIESHLDKSLGPVASVLVNTGTLKIGDNFVVGTVTGRVKKMFDYHKKVVKIATPGMPVQIIGFEKLPEGVGEILQVLPSLSAVREKAVEMRRLLDLRSQEKNAGMSHLINQINAGDLKELKIVLKTDVEGSLEAIRENINKIGNNEVKTKIIHSGVGNVTETDVLMASAADGLLVAFHTKVPTPVEKLAHREGVSIRHHTIIYKLLEETEQLLSGLLDPEKIEVKLGELEIKGIFFQKATEQIVGGLVKSGKLKNNAQVRIFRDGKMIGESKIESLKREKEAVKEVKSGFECGLKLNLKDLKIMEGDCLQAWTVEKQERKFINA
jgi:translation initiation factor IF-2